MSAPHYRPRRRPDRNCDPDLAFATMTRPLYSKEIARFGEQGVNVNVYPVRASTVVLHNGRFSLPGEFRLPDGVIGGFVFPVKDEAGYVADLAAWVPSTGELATWLGCGWALGQSEWPYPLSALREDGAVKVFRSPLTWLQTDCKGLVLLDERQARWRMLRDGGPFIVEGDDHARDLDATLSVRRPRLLIPSKSKVAA